MQKFRSPKLILITSLLLLWGIIAPISGVGSQQQTHVDLTNWLLSFAWEHSSDAANDKIAALRSHQGPVREVMLEASQIIFSHPDLFRSPSGESSASNSDVYQVLLLQWNLQQDASGMSKGVQIERTRAALYQHTASDSGSRSAVSSLSESVSVGFAAIQRTLPTISTLVNVLIKPFLGGIAINAP